MEVSAGVFLLSLRFRQEVIEQMMIWSSLLCWSSYGFLLMTSFNSEITCFD
jgi:hypothetical protein